MLYEGGALRISGCFMTGRECFEDEEAHLGRGIWAYLINRSYDFYPFQSVHFVKFYLDIIFIIIIIISILIVLVSLIFEFNSSYSIFSQISFVGFFSFVASFPYEKVLNPNASIQLTTSIAPSDFTLCCLEDSSFSFTGS